MAIYDNIQRDHYNKVANESQSSSASTMPDFVIRETESKSIINSISEWMKLNNISEEDLSIADLGCGNGTTLSVLSSKFPKAQITGIEFNKALYGVSSSRDYLNKNVTVFNGDLREKGSLPTDEFDIVLTQRVIINIMDRSDQSKALKNILSMLKSGGLYIAIEAFEEGLKLINSSREELGLEHVKMPHHNLHLKDEFFESESSLSRIDLGTPIYFLSTHYYLSYVLYPAIASANGAEFNRNNYFVPFMAKLLPNKGEFGANRFYTFLKIKDS